MAGPIASILLDFIPKEDVLNEINVVIRKISEKVDGDDFRVNTTEPINGNVTTESRLFGIEKNKIDATYFEYIQENIQKIENITGFSPKFDVSFYAMSNKPIDHQILGELTFYIAQKYNGLVDFGGAIVPHHLLPKKMKKGMWIWQEANWNDIQPYFEEMIKNINGSIFSIQYPVNENRNWAFHISDAEFLKNWIKNPNFKMIK